MANNQSNNIWSDKDELSDGSKNKAKAKRSPRQEMTGYGKTAKGGSLAPNPSGVQAMNTHDTGFKPSKGLSGLPRPK